MCYGDGIGPFLFQFFVKMTWTKDFLNPKNQFQDQTKGSIKKQKKVEIKIEGSFWNQELGNTDWHLKFINLFWDFGLIIRFGPQFEKPNLEPKLAKLICDLVFSFEMNKPILGL
jgi:hypothetical protein